MRNTDKELTVDHRRERVAKLVYDWVHENQVTHRRAWGDCPEEHKATYRKLAESMAAVYEDEVGRLGLQNEALTGAHIRNVLRDEDGSSD